MMYVYNSVFLKALEVKCDKHIFLFDTGDLINFKV